MPFDGSGIYTPAVAPSFPAVAGTVIDPLYYNNVINDLASGLSLCLTRDGQGKPSGNIDWNAKNLTNVNALGAVTLTVGTSCVLAEASATTVTVSGLTTTATLTVTGASPSFTTPLSVASGGTGGAALPAGTIVGTSDTQTLTNKRVNPRVVTAGATSGTLTPTSDTADQYNMVGLTGGVTIAAPSGTPVAGQKLMLYFKDNGTARALTWNGVFRAFAAGLPATTTLGKGLYVGCIYNSIDTKWDVVAQSAEI